LLPPPQVSAFWPPQSIVHEALLESIIPPLAKELPQ
jgi:hypothetical protein